MDNMNIEVLAALKISVEEAVSMKIDGYAKHCAEIEALVGRFDLIVPMTAASLGTFQAGRQLDGAAIRSAVLAASLKPLPANMFLADERRFREKLVDDIPFSVDTIIFPVAAAKSKQWVLIVVKMLSDPGVLPGLPIADLIHYDSAGGQYHPSENIAKQVIEYMEKVKKPKAFSCVPRTVHLSRHQNAADSGIAVITNVLALIHGQKPIADLSEIGCWEKRERYARACLESAKENSRALARSEEIVKGKKTAMRQSSGKSVCFDKNLDEDSEDVCLWRAEELHRVTKKNTEANAKSKSLRRKTS